MIDRIRHLFQELRHRKVFRAMAGYLVLSFVTMQVVDATFDLVFEDPGPAGRAVLVALVVFFPVAMVLSWMFDWRPFTLEREAPDPARPAARSATSEYRRVAVLGLRSMGEAEDDLYFSEGVTDDISTSLGQIEGLQIIGRGVTSRYGGVEPDVRTIAAELEASAVVLGSVRRAGRRVRVSVTLVDDTGTQLWSDTFDRELEDLFEVQSELAGRVANAIELRLSPAARRRIEERGTSDPEAYDLYLRGRWLWNQRTKGSTEAALRSLERSVERDPTFALAYAAIAEASTVLALYGAESPAVALRGGRRAVDRALALDPHSGSALAARACLSGIYDWDWEEAEEGYRRALEADPSYATARQWYAMNLLTPLGRYDEAKAEIARARELDPDSLAIRLSPGIIEFYARSYQRSLEIAHEVLEEAQDFAIAHQFAGMALVQLGRAEEANVSLRSAVDGSRGSSESLAALGYGLAVSGEASEAADLLRKLEERRESRYVSRVLIAEVLVGMGRPDEAIHQLKMALTDRATDLIWLKARPSFDAVRTRPGFVDVAKAVGLI